MPTSFKSSELATPPVANPELIGKSGFLPDQSNSSNSLLPISKIPRDDNGRKMMARRMISDARRMLALEQIDEAEAMLYRVKELAVPYGRFEDSPAYLERDIIKARQKKRGHIIQPSSQIKY